MRSVAFRGLLMAAAIVSWTVSPLRAGAGFSTLELNERARPAAQFVDSIGVNVHLSYTGTAYRDATAVRGLLARLGVRHLRDGMTPDRADVCAADRLLARSGVRFTYIAPLAPTAAQLTRWAACVSPATEAFEGPNEYDLNYAPTDHDWPGTLRLSQKQLYRAVRGTRELARFAVIAPSLTSAEAYRSVGDLSADFDLGNIHDYFAAHEPETPGWGLGDYGSIGYAIRCARAVDPNKPIAATESGYGTDRGQRTVDEVTQAIYLPRMLFEQFAAGVVRTYDYELIDEGPAPFSRYGLVDAGFRPKAAFIALASLIALLRDSSAAFVPATVHYAIVDAPQNLQHVLLQKRDGSTLIVLWLAAPAYDPAARAAHEVAPHDLRLRFARAPRWARVYDYGADWRLHAHAVPVAGSLAVAVGDRITLVAFEPAHV